MQGHGRGSVGTRRGEHQVGLGDERRGQPACCVPDRGRTVADREVGGLWSHRVAGHCRCTGARDHGRDPCSVESILQHALGQRRPTDVPGAHHEDSEGHRGRTRRLDALRGGLALPWLAVHDLTTPRTVFPSHGRASARLHMVSQLPGLPATMRCDHSSTSAGKLSGWRAARPIPAGSRIRRAIRSRRERRRSRPGRRRRRRRRR